MSSLYVKQFVDVDLGNSSYLIASTTTGHAAVIDPQRDVDKYLRVADGLGLRIIYSFDTHLHADFVSGAHELAAQLTSDFRIAASARAEAGFEHIPLSEGDRLPLGDLSIGVLTTPGHTPEHISFTANAFGDRTPEALFSGGALIVGGAGRTDLLGHEHAVPLAHELYHTLHHKLLNLHDDVTVYPTHGAGSFCNGQVSSERVTTIGRERATNRLARVHDEDEFVRTALSDLPSYPTYYRHMRAINQKGPYILRSVPDLKPLSPCKVHELIQLGVVVIDTRTPHEFAAGHIPHSYGIPLLTPLITWAGWVVPFGSPIVLIADDEFARDEAVRQLIRIGYDDIRGYLNGGLDAWVADDLPVATTPFINVDELHDWLQSDRVPLVIDVRLDREWRDGHITNAIHIEAGELVNHLDRVPRDRSVVAQCGAGNRATISASLLGQRGYRNVHILDSGFGAWRLAGYDFVEEVA